MTFQLFQTVLYTVFPLVGILFLSWDWRQVIVLYWLENIAIGIATIIRLVSVKNDTPIRTRDESSSEVTLTLNDKPIDESAPGTKFAMAGFFAFHYGLFTLVHGIFVIILVSGVFMRSGIFNAATTQGVGLDIGGLFMTWLIVTIGQIIVVWRQRSAPSSAQQSLVAIMVAPYKRIIVLHLAIIAGAWLIMTLQLPSATAIILIVIHAVATSGLIKKLSKSQRYQ